MKCLLAMVVALLLICWNTASAEELTYTVPEIRELISSGKAEQLKDRKGCYLYSDPARGGTVRFFERHGNICGEYYCEIIEPGKGIVYRESVRPFDKWSDEWATKGKLFAMVRRIESYRYEKDVHVATTVDHEVFLQDTDGNVTMLETDHREDLLVPVEVIDSENYDPNDIPAVKDGEKYAPIRIVVPHELMPPDSEEEKLEYHEKYLAKRELYDQWKKQMEIEKAERRKKQQIEQAPKPKEESKGGIFSADLDIPYWPSGFTEPGPYNVRNPRGKYNINVIQEISRWKSELSDICFRVRGRLPPHGGGRKDSINGKLLLDFTIPDGTQPITKEGCSIPEDQLDPWLRKQLKEGTLSLDDHFQSKMAVPAEGQLSLAIVLDGLWYLDGVGNRKAPYRHIGSMLYKGNLSPGDTILFKPDKDLVPEEMFFSESFHDTIDQNELNELNKRIGTFIVYCILKGRESSPSNWTEAVIPKSDKVTRQAARGAVSDGAHYGVNS